MKRRSFLQALAGGIAAAIAALRGQRPWRATFDRSFVPPLEGEPLYVDHPASGWSVVWEQWDGEKWVESLPRHLHKPYNSGGYVVRGRIS